MGVPGDDDGGSSAGAAWTLDQEQGGPDAWGELMRYLRSENVPGAFPFTAGPWLRLEGF